MFQKFAPFIKVVVDDFFIANASVKLTNGNFSYDGVNPVMISTGPLKWKASTHTGYKTERQTNTFNAFAARADTGGIDNDGDIDVITPEFEGTVCHFNDGKGNFKALFEAIEREQESRGTL